MRTPLAAALAIVLAFACTDQATAPTALIDTPASPSFFIGGPENPGNSGVFRFDTDDGIVLFTFTTAPADNLFTTWFDAPNSSEFGCGSTPSEPSAGQFINNGDDIVKVLSTLQDVPVYVYRFNDFPGFDPAVLCPFFANEWLYAGQASMINTDNDFFDNGPAVNSFGWTGQGTVCDPAGNTYKYQENQRATIENDGTFNILNENIRVIGPVGGGVNNC